MEEIFVNNTVKVFFRRILDYFLKLFFERDKDDILSDSISRDNVCTCHEPYSEGVHSRACPKFVEFDYERDLSSWHKFQLYKLKFYGEISAYEELFQNLKLDIEKEKNSFYEGSERVLESRLIEYGPFELKTRYKRQESTILRSIESELLRQIRAAERVEAFFEKYLNIEVGDCIISRSGTKRIVVDLDDLNIYCQRNEEKKIEKVARTSFLYQCFGWIEDIIKGEKLI